MMENAYGIGITNRFVGFLRRASSDSEDEGDAVHVLKGSDPHPQPPPTSAPPKPKVKMSEKENRTEKQSEKQSNQNAPMRNKGIRGSNQKGGVDGGGKLIGISNSEGGVTPVRGPRNDRPPASFDKERNLKFASDEDREERNNRRNREDGV